MKTNQICFLIALVPAALLAGEPGQWSTKPVAEWTAADCQSILDDSPWAKQVVPSNKGGSSNSEHGRPRGGINVGGIGIGGGGVGGRSQRGSGRSAQLPPSEGPHGEPPVPPLTVRWESALPVQEAHLKLPASQGPSVEEDSYSISVSTVPTRVAGENLDSLEKHLKTKGELRRTGMKAIHSSSVRVMELDHGLMIVFQFPRTSEVTRKDGEIEFATQIGSVKVVQSFSLNDMIFAGKLQL